MNQGLSIVSEELQKFPSKISLTKGMSNNIEQNDKVLNLSPTLTNKFFQTRTNTNELSVSNLEDIPNKNEGTPMHLLRNESNANSFPLIENFGFVENQP